MSSIFTRERIAYYCTALLISAVVVQVFSVVRDRQIGGDFAVFYAEGKLALKYPHSQLYNLDFQEREYSAITGSQETSPFPYPPWFTIPLEFFARLPYLLAFALWTLVSLTFLIGGFLLLARALKLPTAWDRVGVLACLAFPPYLFYTLINGQPAAFAFFILAMTFFLQKNGRQLLAGIILSLLTYKPTLIVFIGPMLLLTRQWRILVGLTLGGTILALISYLWAGAEGYKGFFNLLRLYTQATTSPVEIFQTYKYINIGAALRPLLGPQPKLQFILLLAASLFAFFSWYRVGSRPLSWSIAIVLGLLLSLYTPIYDSTLLIFAVILIGLDTLDTWLVGALYLVPLVTVPIAKFTGIQLYTIVLIVFLFVLVRRALTSAYSRSKLSI
jgi:alpha-1,2-mannosyltransferase